MREWNFHDIKQALSMRNKPNETNPKFFLAGHTEVIPNKIKWDIDELVLKVNDLLRPLISTEPRIWNEQPESDIILNKFPFRFLFGINKYLVC